MVRVKQEKTSQIINIFHSSSQGVTIFRILLSACAHCRQNRCFNSPRRLTGRRNSPRRLARFEKGVLDVAHGDLRVPPPWTLFMISKKKERRQPFNIFQTVCFCKVVSTRNWTHGRHKDYFSPLQIGWDIVVIMHLVTQSSPPVAKLSNLNWLVVMTPTDFPNISTWTFRMTSRNLCRTGAGSGWARSAGGGASRLVLQLWIWETSICLTLRAVPIGNCRWMWGFGN